MLAAGLELLEATNMYRSSLTLAFCCPVLRGRRGQRPVIRLRGARRNLRAFRRRLCASGTGLSATALRGTRLRISAALLWDAGPAYRAPAAVYGEYGAPYAAQPAYVDRAPAYPERYYAPRASLRSDRYYAQEHDYAPEYAPRPPLSVPYRARARCVDDYGRSAYCD